MTRILGIDPGVKGGDYSVVVRGVRHRDGAITVKHVEFACQSARPFKPAPDHDHKCRKLAGHRGRHRCGCFGGKCTVSWRTK